MNYILYAITNKIDNKLYVGQTTRTIKERYSKGLNETSNRYLKHAIQKYGLDNFSIVQICKVKNLEELNACEEFLIKELKSHVSFGTGYNLEWGGKNKTTCDATRRLQSIAHIGQIPGNKGKHHTEASKIKMSISRKGKKLTEKHKQNISFGGSGLRRSENSKKNISAGKRGKKLSEEHKQNLSQSHMSKPPWNKGKTNVYSEETKLQISNTLKGRKISKKALEKRKGRKLSDETKLKMSIAHKGRKYNVKGKKESDSTLYMAKESINE